MIKPSRYAHLKRTDKGECQKLHFMRRFRERLGIHLTEEQYYEIISCIKNDKTHRLFTIKRIGEQSRRLHIYEIQIPEKEPMDILYDVDREAIVTVLNKKDGDAIYHYYDVFNNKLQIKEHFGYGGWKMLDGMLTIPDEEIVQKNGYFEIVSEGVLKDRRFKYINNELIEVM